MGDANKLTRAFEGKPLLLHVMDALRDSDVSDVVVVTGFERAKILSLLSGRNVRFVDNPGYDSGMASSIVAGIKSTCDAKGALICLGDMPGISQGVISAVLGGFRSDDSIVLPVHQGRFGHPVLFGRHHFRALKRLTGDDGAKSLVAAADVSRIEIECGGPGIYRDVDTPEDFAHAADALRDDRCRDR
jgi:molybdenum cofactor cytidylyltransferase